MNLWNCSKSWRKPFCHRGSKTTGRCNLCTRFFVDVIDYWSCLDFYYTIKKYDLENLSIFPLIRNSTLTKFTLFLYYVVTNSWREASANARAENFGEIFTEGVFSPLSLYIIIFLNVFLRIYFSSLKEIADTIIYHIDRKFFLEHKKKLLFSIFKKYVHSDVVVLEYCNSILNGFSFNFMFSNYRPKIDYCDDYFSIKNLWDGGFFAGL